MINGNAVIKTQNIPLINPLFKAVEAFNRFIGSNKTFQIDFLTNKSWALLAFIELTWKTFFL